MTNADYFKAKSQIAILEELMLTFRANTSLDSARNQLVAMTKEYHLQHNQN